MSHHCDASNRSLVMGVDFRGVHLPLFQLLESMGSFEGSIPISFDSPSLFCAFRWVLQMSRSNCFFHFFSESNTYSSCNVSPFLVNGMECFCYLSKLHTHILVGIICIFWLFWAFIWTMGRFWWLTSGASNEPIEFPMVKLPKGCEQWHVKTVRTTCLIAETILMVSSGRTYPSKWQNRLFRLIVVVTL